jgi:hypothetical protein
LPLYSYEKLDTQKIIQNLFKNLQNRFMSTVYDKIFSSFLSEYSSVEKVNINTLRDRWDVIKNNPNSASNLIDRYLSDADYYSYQITHSIVDGIFPYISNQIESKLKF